MNKEMDQRGLKDREQFQKDLMNLMGHQGIAAVGVAFVTDEGYADYEGRCRDDNFDLDLMRRSLNELLEFCDDVERQRAEKK